MKYQDKLIIECAIEALNENLKQPGQSARDPATVRQLIRLSLEGSKDEEYFGVFLDAQLCVISAEHLRFGTIFNMYSYAREIARRALDLNADALIMAHNHPSGDPTPSAKDREMTATVAEGLRLFDIRLVDHIVVGSGRMTSLSDEKLLVNPQRSNSRKSGNNYARSRRIRRTSQNPTRVSASVL